VISRPLQPDYLFFNYLEYPITVLDYQKDQGVAEGKKASIAVKVDASKW
jgi:hypothetical protein